MQKCSFLNYSARISGSWPWELASMLARLLHNPDAQKHGESWPWGASVLPRREPHSAAGCITLTAEDAVCSEAERLFPKQEPM